MKTIRAFVRCFLMLAFPAASLVAAEPPPWLKPALATDLSDWKENGVFVWLQDSERVQFLSPTRTRTLIRRAARMHGTSTGMNGLARIVYNANTQRVSGARAWSITADGKKTTAYQRSDFSDSALQQGEYFWNSRRIFALPIFDAIGASGLGGVVAWEFEIDSDSGVFDASHEFLASRPVAFGSFEVVPAPGTKLVWRASSSALAAPTVGAEPGSLRWEMRRVAAAGRDEPDGFLANPLEVDVRCETPAKTGTTATLSTWENLAQLVAGVIEPRIEITSEITAKAASLTAGRTSRWERIRALSEFVQRDVYYLSVTVDRDSFAGYRPHPPAEALKNRYGDCKDKATLLAGLLRASGDNGFVVLVYSGNPRVVPPDWPSACFNHAIAAIPADENVPGDWPVVVTPQLGRLVVFDPTDPVTPLGALPERDQAGHGLVVHHNSGALVQLPSESTARMGLDRSITVTLDAAGGLRASVEETRRGARAADLFSQRSELRDEKFGGVLQERLSQTVSLAREVRWSDTWDAAAVSHVLKLDFSAERQARTMGRDRLMLSAQLIAGTARLDPWKTTHEGTVWLPVLREHEVVRIAVPEGLVIEEVPEDFIRESPLAKCRLLYRVEGTTIVYERAVEQNTEFLEQADYELLRTFVQKLSDAERRPAILRRL